MLSMNYVGEATTYSVEFQYVNKNRVRLFGNFPAKKKGFILTRIGDPRAFRGDYTEYDTIYREYDDSVEFSNNNEIYNPYRFVTFSNTEGGTLEGELKQEVKDYSELVIPTPSANEDYVFECWSPEIPTEGEILHDTVFTAVFKSTLPPPPPEPTLEERVTLAEQNIAQNTSDIIDTQNALCELSMLSE